MFGGVSTQRTELEVTTVEGLLANPSKRGEESSVHRKVAIRVAGQRDDVFTDSKMVSEMELLVTRADKCEGEILKERTSRFMTTT